jgi:hypothetical protein
MSKGKKLCVFHGKNHMKKNGTIRNNKRVIASAAGKSPRKARKRPAHPHPGQNPLAPHDKSWKAKRKPRRDINGKNRREYKYYLFSLRILNFGD